VIYDITFKLHLLHYLSIVVSRENWLICKNKFVLFVA